MNRLSAAIPLLALAIPLAGSVAKSQSGGITPADAFHGKPTLVKLAPPVYPAIARAAQVAGDVEVNLEIRSDGTVQSAFTISGPPLLINAALDSARQSQFECRDCGEAAAPIHLTYTFQLIDTTAGCCTTAESASKGAPSGPTPGVTQSQSHITILVYQQSTWQPVAIIRAKVRSPKCLYLWKCSLR